MNEKIIKIECRGAALIPLEELEEFQGNLKKITRANLDKLKRRIMKSFDAPIHVWERPDGSKKILDGHQRRKALRELSDEGYEIPPLPVDYIYAKDEKEARQKLLGITSQYGEFEMEELGEWMRELDADDADTIRLSDGELKIKIEEDEEPEFPDVETAMLEEDILKHDRFYFAFSGGKDSALSLFKMLPVLKQENKAYEVLYVDTGVEFPDLLEYIYRITGILGVELKVLHPRKNFYDVYSRNKKWPDSIFRDCIETLINDSLDRYCNESGEPYVLIRGGRPDQKTSRSGMKKIQKIKSKPLMTIYNPLYDLTKKEYEAELEKIPLWDGYKKGFARTACWCCPFQNPQQWDAMKIHYPVLYERIGVMFQTLAFREHKGDGFLKKIRKYWGEVKTC